MNEKKCQILDAAFKVFARFGMRKTSIDDIAKASAMSRQGIYLHFKNKEEIFQATLEKYLKDRSADAHAALEKTSSLEERITLSLLEWLGRSIGFIHQDASDLIESAADFRPRFDELSSVLKKEMTKAIQSETKANLELSERAAAILMATGMTWKHELKTQEEFEREIKSATRLLLSGLRSSSL